MGTISEVAQGESETSAIKTKIDLANTYNVDVTSVTVTSGTLSATDVTAIASIGNDFTLDISGASVSDDQLWTLLSNEHITTLTLSDAQKTQLKALSGKTYTTDLLSKIGTTASDFASGMTTKNFIIDGSTLYVTGELTEGDLTTIKDILDANSDITTLDVSKCTNSSGTVTITDSNLSTYVKTVSLPGNDYIVYSGTQATALTNGTLTISIPSPYTSIDDAVTKLSSLLSSGAVENIKVTGTLTATDLANAYKLGGNFSGKIKTIDLSAVELASGVTWANMNNTNGWGGANVLLPDNTDLSVISSCVANVFSKSGTTLKAVVNAAGDLGDADFIVNNSSATTLAVVDGNSSSGGAGSAAIAAISTFTGMDILDLTGATDKQNENPDMSGLGTNYSTVLSPVDNTSKQMVITGELTNTVLGILSNITTTPTSIDFSGVTSVDGDLDWSNLTGPTSVEYIMLPASQYNKVGSLSKASLTGLKGAGAVNDGVGYAHIYEEVEAGAVKKLSDTFTKESVLPFSTVSKFVVSSAEGVTLNNNSAKLATYAAAARAYDVSGATFTDLKQVTVAGDGNDQSYIILPASTPTADMLTCCDANKWTSLGYVYVINGTSAKVAVSNGKDYAADALKVARLGTGVTSVTLYGNNNQVNATHVANAINGATDSNVTSVSLEYTDLSNTGTLEVTNAKLTSLTLNNGNGTLTSGWTLTIGETTNNMELNVSGQQLAAITSNNTHLTSVSLNEATISGNVDLSSTGITTLNTNLANIAAGTLNISGIPATSLDLTKLTAKAVNASNTTSLTTLNLNGITLDGTKDIDNRIGTVEVTRSSSDYSNLTINVAEGFDKTRIIPGEEEPAEGSRYTINQREAQHVEITVAGNALGTTVPAKLATMDETPRPNEVEILHVTGTLTADDVAYIKDNLPNLVLLDLSQCSYSGTTGDAIVDAFVANGKQTTAIVFPTNSSAASETSGAGTVNQHEVWYASSQGMKCAAYFTDATRNMLNVFGLDDNVAKLGAAKENQIIASGATSITFEPAYVADPANGMAAAMPAENSNLYPKATATFISSGLSALPAISIDMTWLDISQVGCDFTHTNDATHYIVIPQNTKSETRSSGGVTYHNDFTNETADTETDKYYHYNDNIWVVATYKGTAAPYATQAYFGGEGIQYDNGTYALNKSANLTYLRVPGKLSGARNYVSDLQKSADMMSIAGNLGKTDLAAMDVIRSEYVDLTRATLITSGDDAVGDWSSYDNDYVKYVALPYGTAESLDKLPNLKTNCSALEGIGSFNKGEDLIPTTSSKKGSLVYKSYKEDAMDDVILMMIALNQTDRKHKITNLIVGGPVNAKDVSNGGQTIDENGHLVTVTSGAGSSEPGTMSAGAGTQYGALNNITAYESWDLTYAELPSYASNDGKSYAFENTDGTYSYQNDLCFGLLGMTGTADIKLPISKTVWRLPNSSFANAGSVYGGQVICIPGNYKELGAYAFTSDNLKAITTTQTDAVYGNGYPVTDTEHLINMGDWTCALPPSLTLIENGTFFNNEHFTDVYITTPSGQDTPACWKDAFSSGTTYGWGGFDNTPPITKDDYVRDPTTMTATQKTFGILHWPAGITETEHKRYTDPTREYSITDQLMTTDADGNVYVWPNQTEYNRAFSQGSNGYLWDGYLDKESYDNQDKQAAADTQYDETSNTAPAEIFYSPTLANLQYYAGAATASDYTTKDYDKTTYDKDYRGWHQFVLTGSANVKTVDEPDPDPTWNFKKYKENDWYSICLPFDMNEDDVLHVFGATGAEGGSTIADKFGNPTSITLAEGETLMPNITQLYQVERNVDGKNITLWFTENIASTKKEWNPAVNSGKGALEDCETDGAGKKIIIKAGYPYLIKPYLPADELAKAATYAGRTFSYTANANKEDYRDYDATKGSKLPKKDWVVTGVKTHAGAEAYEAEDKNYCQYLFVGTYEDVTPLPMYSYFLANNGTKNTWYYNVWGPTKYKDAEGNPYPWPANTCIVVSHRENINTVDYYRKTSDAAADSYKLYFKSADTGIDAADVEMTSDALYDNSNNVILAAKGMAFGFPEGIYDQDDNVVTTIESVEPDGRIVVSLRGDIYNMSGQLVRKNGTLDGLNKGIYMMNGKKYVVK